MKKPRNETLRFNYRGETVDISARVRRNAKDLIIFLHGIGCNKESFNQAFRAKALQGYSICAFDFPGHGKSSKLPDAHYSLQSYADITNLVIRDLAFNRIYVVGHSMGGAVGVIASQEADSIEFLVSADGNLVAEDCGLVSRKIADQSAAAFVPEGFGQFLAVLQNSSRNDFRAWLSWCKDADPHALHQAARSLVEWSDSGKLLEFFNAFAPKAYLYGEQDDKDYLRQQIASASVFAVPGAGHFMMVDNPESFYQMLAGLLASSASRHTDCISASF